MNTKQAEPLQHKGDSSDDSLSSEQDSPISLYHSKSTTSDKTHARICVRVFCCIVSCAIITFLVLQEGLRMSPLDFSQSLGQKGIGDVRKVDDLVLIKQTLYQKGNLQRGNTFWINYQEVKCMDNSIINSGVRLQQNLYAQKTVYDKVALLYRSMHIPAVNVYQYEPVRQFFNNISMYGSPQRILVDHYASIIPVFVSNYFKKGFLLSDRNDWQIQQKNMVLNNLMPLVNRVKANDLFSLKQVDLIVTYDVRLMEHHIKESRAILILLHITEPQKIPRQVRQSSTVYVVSKGEGCQEGELEIFSDRIITLQEDYLYPQGWYVFAKQKEPLFEKHLHKDYQPKIYDKEQAYQCTDQPNAVRQTFRNKVLVFSMPINGLYLFGIEGQKVNIDFCRLIFTYVKQFVFDSKILIMNGPLQVMVTLASAASPNSQIFVLNTYPNKKIFQKNLVLNNLERVTLISKEQVDQHEFSLTIINEYSEYIGNNTAILFNSIKVNSTKDIQARKVQVNGCFSIRVEERNSLQLQQGVYELK